jgi:hypothetical protein
MMMEQGMTFFGVAFDAGVREIGGWPDGAIAYEVEVIGSGDDPQVMVTGGVPIGAKRDGSPKLGTIAQSGKYRATIPLSRYRELLAVPA